jgi:hypothetical protein
MRVSGANAFNDGNMSACFCCIPNRDRILVAHIVLMAGHMKFDQIDLLKGKLPPFKSLLLKKLD